jgi:DNA (cytosine-5)-methyltransferase 1
MKHLGDICKISGADIEPVWCITGGSPCQDLSIAGKRAGLAGSRSGLFMEQVRIVREMREHDRKNGRTGDMVRPRFMVWENVPGAFSSNGGSDFAAVLEEIIRIEEPEAPDIEVPEKGWPTWGGYHDEVGGRWSVAWRVHDAQYWGVPQRRRRISIVADFGGDTAGEILFECKSVSGHPAESGAAGERLAGTAESGASYAVRIRGGCDGGGKGALVQEDKSGTLGTGNDQTIFQNCLTQWDCQSKRIFGTEGEAPTLQGGVGGGVNNPAIFCMETQRDCVMPSQALTEVASSCKQRDFKDSTDLVCAIDCRSFCEGGETNGTLQAKSNGGTSYNLQNTVRTGMIVRRLTPMECERLQGYPDGWTDIGEWMDSKGKRHKDAYSPRYKALGNSIALPFWQWLIDRMAAYLPEGATMGSLFDGIGGFPLCWQRTHGDGTAKWASEIEQFPIAVTKLRFGED